MKSETPFFANILIVDDVPANIQLVASLLADQDYELSFATSGQDALDQVQETDFDLILLDFMMPGMDGIEVAYNLKQNQLTQDIPIIFLTAKTDEESVIAGFQAGAADYVTKPFNSAELLARVQTHLQLKYSRDALQKRNQELQEAIEMKNRFLSIASHDLKNPLGVVMGFSAILAQEPLIQANTDFSEIVGTLQKASTRMFELVTELLDTAALEMGRIDLQLSRVPLNILVQQSVSHYFAQAQAKEQEILLSVVDDAIVTVMGDFSRLKQIIDNLLNNAIKYAPLKSPIQIQLLQTANRAQIRIQDHGPGFSEEDKKHMYGYFQRLSAQPTGGETSTGVGLAIVKQIVDLHQGQILLEPTPGGGATFIIDLPLSE
jgi:two-component system, sensor histidine kinase and response regulator